MNLSLMLLSLHAILVHFIHVYEFLNVWFVNYQIFQALEYLHEFLSTPVPSIHIKSTVQYWYIHLSFLSDSNKIFPNLQNTRAPLSPTRTHKGAWVIHCSYKGWPQIGSGLAYSFAFHRPTVKNRWNRTYSLGIWCWITAVVFTLKWKSMVASVWKRLLHTCPSWATIS